MGVIPEKLLSRIDAQFDALDIDNNGILNKHDLWKQHEIMKEKILKKFLHYQINC